MTSMSSNPPESLPPVAAAGEAAPDPGSEHRLAQRRRRRSRRRGNRQMMSAAVLGLLIGTAGAALGVAGAVSFVGTQEDRAEREAEEEREKDFIAACQARVKGVDCGCLWRDARPAFLPDTRDEVLALIAGRETLPLRVQRIRTERLVGPELAKTVWGAAYYCVKP